MTSNTVASGTRDGSSRSWVSSLARLYWRCVGWGLATGAVTGALTGAAVLCVSGLGDGSAATLIALPLVGAFYGLVVGTVVSVIPTVLVSAIVESVIRRRHPHPSSTAAVERDLGVIFGIVLATLNVALVLIIFTGGNGITSVVRSLAVVGVGNVGACLVLWRARASIGRAWSMVP